jgi:iron(III) transport system substrate-binding protein
MLRNVFILLALLAIVGLPFALKPKDNLIAEADETLVIISPHNEAIRYEFSRGFRDWYKAKTGKTARIDWRIPGGTTEIARYLASEYQAPFEYNWRKVHHLPWTEEVRRSFDDGKIKLGADPAKDLPPMAARRAFLESDITIGIDLFFGGGSFDVAQQGAAGRLVDSGFIKSHPEMFGDGPGQIPQTLGGEVFWDKAGTWMGTVVSAFGICYNDDSLAQLKIAKPPENWKDLADPRYFAQVALADPNKSGSVAKVFEMIIQQQIQRGMRDGAEQADKQTIQEGWDKGLRLIQKMGANTRYFTDAATKIAIDVGDGDAAIGMAIDFYGRFQAESTRNPKTGRDRMHYFNAPGGTSIGVDSIAMLRGAPHRQLALDFIEYVMSAEGQKLWNFKVGAPGGPTKYALRRLPIRHELYAPEFAAYRSDPTVYPYEDAKNFTYRPEWTGALFNPIRFIVRVMCIDSHDEARGAMAALIRAKFPPEATAAFEDVSAVNYEQANGRIKDTLRSSDPLAAVRLAKELSEHFRAQYRHAEELAQAGK